MIHRMEYMNDRGKRYIIMQGLPLDEFVSIQLTASMTQLT